MQIFRQLSGPLDSTLTVVLFILFVISLTLLSSAAPERLASQGGNIMVALVALWACARVPLAWVQRLALPVFFISIMLLVGVDVFGEVSKGARRWLGIGPLRFQPSEIIKVTLPVVLAWYFWTNSERGLSWIHYVGGVIFILIPAILIALQPDLGTSILVVVTGIGVLFFMNLSWKFFVGLVVLGLGLLPIIWPRLSDYQRNRVFTLFNPEQDALGAGFHVIQSTIAVGSGGVLGKGWGHGTQSHLNFLPERHTDFIFAVLAEEFGLLGCIALFVVFLALISRCVTIAARAPDLFARLLASSITLIIFISFTVNIGMVAGLLPVVGVPLPWVSYGGSAMVVFCTMLGLLMNISHHQHLIQR